MALDQIKEERLKKLENIKNSGVDPYPARVDSGEKRLPIIQARESMDQIVVVVGRIRSLRPHGKIAFADLEDQSGRIQAFFEKNSLNEKFDFLENLDLGDFLQIEGQIFQTQAGEITIRVQNFQLLSKTLLPLPSSWYGLKDIEERNRRRYLDLIMNSDVRKTFEARSKIIHHIRKFLIEKKGYIEVEDPVLQPLYGGTRARPFKTHHNTLDMDLYLRISNELYLKRLIVGGFEKVFEIGHTFRNEGMDRNHNPEFTMLETMEAYADYMDNMNLVEEMFEYVAQSVFGTTKLMYQGTELEFKRPWARIKLTDLFEKNTGIKFQDIDTLEKATELAKKLGIEIQDYMTDGEVLLEIFEKKCTSELIQPTFIYDYPADFYPLAKKKVDDARFVESFDIYVAGMEMGTNYTEQNDPDQIREAWLKEKEKEAAGNPEAQILDEDFLEALEYGMPPTSGIGPGIDRWIMVMTDSASISDVILFPTLRPLKKTSSVTMDRGEKLVDKKEIVSSPIPHNDGSGKAPTRDEAYQLMTEMIKNPNLQKHGVAVEAIMRTLCSYLREREIASSASWRTPRNDEGEFNEEEWAVVGLLHDADYELIDKDTSRHTLVTEQMLRERGFDNERVIQAIKAHHDGIKDSRDNLMESSVYATDELSGLITAVALVRPEKKLSAVDVESVMKKFKQPSFAAGANREQIKACETELNIPLEEFVAIGLKAMKGISDDLGL